MRGGRVLLTEPDLILRFVQLERALRGADLSAVQRRTAAIEAALTRRGLRHLVYFAYWYAWYHRPHPTTSGQAAIRAWAEDALSHFGRRYRSALSSQVDPHA